MFSGMFNFKILTLLTTVSAVKFSTDGSKIVVALDNTSQILVHSTSDGSILQKYMTTASDGSTAKNGMLFTDSLLFDGTYIYVAMSSAAN